MFSRFVSLLIFEVRHWFSLTCVEVLSGCFDFQLTFVQGQREENLVFYMPLWDTSKNTTKGSLYRSLFFDKVSGFSMQLIKKEAPTQGLKLYSVFTHENFFWQFRNKWIDINKIVFYFAAWFICKGRSNVIKKTERKQN